MNDETIMRGDAPDVSDVRPANAELATPTSRSTMTANAEQEPVVPLLTDEESQSMSSRWERLQVSFVDEPRHSVERADQLVNEAINGLVRGFSSQRERLEQQWHRDQDVSTEDLRIAFRRYRSFFERLVSM